jgi:hypothetical protein
MASSERASTKYLSANKSAARKVVAVHPRNFLVGAAKGKIILHGDLTKPTLAVFTKAR